MSLVRRSLFCGVALLAIYLPAGHAQSAGGLTRTPIPIYNPAPLLPVETAGTGISPEVAVQVELDARGAVTAVTVRSIRPGSSFDEQIEASVREQLSAWRYAPRLQDGTAVPAQLEWTVKLLPRSNQPTYGSGAGAVDPESTGSLPAAGGGLDLWKQLRSLTEAQRLQALDTAITSAKSHLGDDPRKADGKAFVVWADSTSEQIAALLAQNLDATFGALIDMFGDAIELQQPKHKIVAFIYSTRETFDGFRSEAMDVDNAAGFYNPVGLIAFHREMPTDNAVMSVLIHEATHAFVDRYLLRDGVGLPIWMTEGFAEYIGNSRVKNGKLVPGKIPHADTMVTEVGVLRMEAQQKLDVVEAKRAVRKGTALSLKELIGAERNQFYGERMSDFYTMGWLLVHYLREGEAGWAEQKFPVFVLYLSEGYPAADSFREIYGRDLQEMESGFHEYIRGF